MKEEFGRLIFWSIFAVGVIGLIFFAEWAWAELVRAFAYRGEVG